MLGKSIDNKKEYRQPYRGSKRFDRSCRNHGSCDYCKSNRTHFDKKARMRVEGQENEWFDVDPYDASAIYEEELLEARGMDAWDIVN